MHQLSLKEKEDFKNIYITDYYQLSLCGSLSLVYYKFSEVPILLFETEDTENFSIADYPEPVMNKWFVITARQVFLFFFHIKFVFLLTVNHTILIMLVQRI